MNFALIGDGQIARYHREAIKHVGGNLIAIWEPFKKYQCSVGCQYVSIPFQESAHARYLSNNIDFFVICSPSHMHRTHIRAIEYSFPGSMIICEKPYRLPWEPPIDNDKVNVVLQLNWAKELDGVVDADMIQVQMYRNSEYMESDKGNPMLTGGLFYNLFIHYAHLAMKYRAGFEGIVLPGNGKRNYLLERPRYGVSYRGELQENIDLSSIDYQTAYNRMYNDIMEGKGIKPKDVEMLHWLLSTWYPGKLGESVRIDKKMWGDRMKEIEIRDSAKCAICGNPFGSSGVPLFYRVSIKRYGVNLPAVQRQTGLAMFFGGNPVLAQAMGADEDMASVISEAKEFTVCENCSTHSTCVASLAEMGEIG